jgi:hypothetical protein
MTNSTELFVKISHNIVENPKIVTLSCEARWAYLESIVYAARNFTDGLIDRRILHQRWSDSVIEELTTNDEKPSWIMLDNGDVQIYAFCDWQMTAEKRDEIREKRSRAGVKSGEARRETNKTRTSVQQVFEHNANKNELEVEVEVEVEKKKPLSAESRKTQLRADWQPSDTILSTVAVKYPLVDIAYESERFMNYWMSKGTPMKDWGLTWQNWMLRKQKELSEKQPAAHLHHPPEDDWMYKDVKWGPERYE